MSRLSSIEVIMKIENTSPAEVAISNLKICREESFRLVQMKPWHGIRAILWSIIIKNYVHASDECNSLME